MRDCEGDLLNNSIFEARGIYTKLFLYFLKHMLEVSMVKKLQSSRDFKITSFLQREYRSD